MATKTKELPKMMEMKTHDSTCRVCHGTPKDKVSANQAWAWSLRNPGKRALKI